MPSYLLRFTFVSITVVYLASTHSLPIVDQGLFVIQGVSTCGQSQGYCLLSNSCQVDTDFENDVDGGHCEGLQHGFNPNAHFICCRFKPPATTTVELETTVVPEAPPELSTSEATTTSTTVTSTSTTTENVGNVNSGKEHSHTEFLSPLFNAVAHTNRILGNLTSLLQGAKIPPSVALSPQIKDNDSGEEDNSSTELGFIQNDKSLINLILLGMNETLTTESPRSSEIH